MSASPDLPVFCPTCGATVPVDVWFSHWRAHARQWERDAVAKRRTIPKAIAETLRLTRPTAWDGLLADDDAHSCRKRPA
jgi:glutamine synthetase adenylyltransferase